MHRTIKLRAFTVNPTSLGKVPVVNLQHPMKVSKMPAASLFPKAAFLYDRIADTHC